MLLDILRRIEFRGQGTGNGSINVDVIVHGTKLFVAVLESKSSLVVSKQAVVGIFLQKIRNKSFANYVVTCGLRELSYSQWTNFIRDRVREFNEVNLAASVIWEYPRKVRHFGLEVKCVRKVMK